MKQIPLILLGAGGVGQALLRQIVAGRAMTAARNRLRLNVVAVADSRSWRMATGGLADEALHALLAAKTAGQPVGDSRPGAADIVAAVHAAGVRDAILVDATAEAGLEPALNQALTLNYGVVLANKKALAGPWATAQRYFNNPRLRHESTVGGGQPVIATLRYLLDTNDPILRIEGQLSGTLGYICSQLDEEIPFSRALMAARAQGFTEPDPREDLGGEDVMRKVLILARMAGWPLEAADIPVESLYPAELASLSVDAFMLASPTLDAALQARVAAAQAVGNVLRYTAVVEEGQAAVGLQPVPANSPLAHLKYVSFRTGRYDDEALLIGGKGAGVEMTAAGVLGDIIALARAS